MATETLFETNDDPVIDPDKDYFSELVGEGKKYKDEKAVGRAVVEKDVFIEKVTKENAEMREKLAEAATLQAVLDRLEAERNKETPSRTNNQHSETEDQPTVTKESVETLVQQALEQRSKANVEASNISKARDVLSQAYGPGYQAILAEKAKELGVGPQFLDDMAKKTPQALFALLGIGAATQQPRPQATRPGTIANPGTARSGVKNYRWFKEKYGSRIDTLEVHNEMMKELEAQGDDFYA